MFFCDGLFFFTVPGDFLETLKMTPLPPLAKYSPLCISYLLYKVKQVTRIGAANGTLPPVENVELDAHQTVGRPGSTSSKTPVCCKGLWHLTSKHLQTHNFVSPKTYSTIILFVRNNHLLVLTLVKGTISSTSIGHDIGVLVLN